MATRRTWTDDRGRAPMSRVTILGAGSWGTALASILQPRHAVTLWSRDADLADAIAGDRQNRRYLPGVDLWPSVAALSDLGRALAGSEAVVFAIPSAGMEDVCRLAAPLIARDALLVSASKGLTEEGGLRMSQVIGRALDGAWATEGSSRRVAVISGPNLAMEVAMGHPSATVAACQAPELAERSRALFMGPAFRVYSSDDVVGVELAGAMKNVIAIGCGICEGRGYGDNTRAALMTRGLAEITRLGLALGAKQSTFLGLAGVGDLIATGGSRLSRNYRVGVGLGRGRALAEVLADIGQVAEGVPTTRAMWRLAGSMGAEMPITRSMYGLLFEEMAVDHAVGELMLRPPRAES
ncbi:MAG: NAD(P)-dependent glycerol-3-phosphate dehydrogenase [Armatimonadetes bacterium]|nr:NAD(P)-dependent glycerol-3-phosphate dehydrogenase [Armatimonadota bacterium]